MLVAVPVFTRAPPVIVSPLLEARPEVPALMPPVKVEVPVPDRVRIVPPVMLPVMWAVLEALSASERDRVPAMVEEALETKPFAKWKARLSEAEDDAV